MKTFPNTQARSLGIMALGFLASTFSLHAENKDSFDLKLGKAELNSKFDGDTWSN